MNQNPVIVIGGPTASGKSAMALALAGHFGGEVVNADSMQIYADLPIILHCREADEQMADLLEEEMGKGAFRPLLHCYTGGAELARRAADLGSFFSASGIITFKKAEDVRAVFRDIVPEDRVIIETDCPYLAPTPYRGRRNEPKYLPHVLEKLCEVKGWSSEEGEQRTTDAALRLFDRIEIA